MAPTIRSAIAKLKMNMLLTWKWGRKRLNFQFEFFLIFESLENFINSTGRIDASDDELFKLENWAESLEETNF